MTTTRSDSGTPRLDKRNASSTESAAVLAPRARAIVSTAIAVSAFRRARNRRSSIAFSPSRVQIQRRLGRGVIPTNVMHAFDHAASCVLPLFPRDSHNGGNRPVDVVFRRRPGDDAHTHGGRSLPDGPAAPTGSVFL